MKNDMKLLLLEDDLSDAELIQAFLRRSGLEFTASIASDRQEFETAVLENTFDAVLADNSLPQFGSIDALKWLQKHNIDCPFILVTGAVSEEFAVNILHSGADDYILKSNLTRLPNSIAWAIEKKKVRREKAAAEEDLRKGEEKYRMLFEMNPLPAWVVDKRTHAFLTVNAAAVKHYGYSYDEFARMNITSVQPGENPDSSGWVRHVKKGGESFKAEIVTSDVNYENRPASLVMINDLTLKLKAEEEIKQINRELRDLSSHLQNVREEERIQIARDIHDELGQQLTGLKMEIYSLGKKVEKFDGVIMNDFGDVTRLVDDLIKSVRKIASNLRPSMLDDFGLVAALKWQSQEVETRFGIKILFIDDFPEINIPAGISTGLFRIYQEALTNAVRHANAHIINSSLKLSEGRIILEIKDDGKGIAQDAGPKKKGLGLVGIKERIFVMNGNYELESHPGKGTSLCVSVPLLVTG